MDQIEIEAIKARLLSGKLSKRIDVKTEVKILNMYVEGFSKEKILKNFPVVSQREIKKLIALYEKEEPEIKEIHRKAMKSRAQKSRASKEKSKAKRRRQQLIMDLEEIVEILKKGNDDKINALIKNHRDQTSVFLMEARSMQKSDEAGTK